MSPLAPHRDAIRAAHLADEAAHLAALSARFAPSEAHRAEAHRKATDLVEQVRADKSPGLMEVFLAEYGLSTEEGVALMCLAEALLRVPDAATMDALIEDKIAPSEWGAHLGHSSSSLVNASTWGLMLTGKVLKDGQGVASVLRGAVRRLGEPVIRTAARAAMREMGNQFVLGESIDAAVSRGAKRAAQGYTFSYDMLGEAAMTAADAESFRAAYADAIARLAPRATHEDIRENPGISIKLSALHPRYEEPQRARVMAELVPRVLALAEAAKDARMGLNIDAEEADRLEISLDVIEAVLAAPSLAGWDGFGVVVQGYGKRASAVIDWLYALATRLDRRVMVRLVKGAYWDTEIKRAQAEGLPGFPVYTRKATTDAAYLCCARQLLELTDRIYPQFATHNAHTVAAILAMAEPGGAYEFQRLHGMGETLHELVRRQNAARCRIYAPVGAHRDLLAYLVRRLLENGANSSFVNQIVDTNVPAARVAADPFDAQGLGTPNPAVTAPPALFAPERRNSAGWDLHDPATLEALDQARAPFTATRWSAGQGGEAVTVTNPADPSDTVGTAHFAPAEAAGAALDAARVWDAPPEARRATLERAADLYEAHHGELFALLAREAGKTPADAVAELREAVDFLRYYAANCPALTDPARGRIVCISPWNFPLAIFTGQIAAALAAGNAVIAKPAEATPLIAARAVALLHEAGVPERALTLLVGEGATLGAALTADPRTDGVAFTGSTATAHAINRAMAADLAPDAPLIAETGGLNAMIVDSTALPEQAVRDIVESAFRSAGQRCSALRMLYVQRDVAEPFLRMLFGAMEELCVGEPWSAATDLGPVIDRAAQDAIKAHIEAARAEGRVLRQIACPERGSFVAPTAIKVSGIAALEREIFGPVLHIATYRAEDLDRVIDAINATGYGLTFGMHSRIDDRVQQVASRIRAGNLYINRNQIGAIVGSQPFGGEGLSGTGPKAGGPQYLPRFTRAEGGRDTGVPGAGIAPEDAQRLINRARPGSDALSAVTLPGPTGESNRLSIYPRGTVLCLGPTAELAARQARQARAKGCAAIPIAPGATGEGALDGTLPAEALTKLTGFHAVAFAGPEAEARACRVALAERDGPILPLLTASDIGPGCIIERHQCIDTTAAGGNAKLLAAVS